MVPGFLHLDVTNKTLKLWGYRYGSISKVLVVQAAFSISKTHELIFVAVCDYNHTLGKKRQEDH